MENIEKNIQEIRPRQSHEEIMALEQERISLMDSGDVEKIKVLIPKLYNGFFDAKIIDLLVKIDDKAQIGELAKKYEEQGNLVGARIAYQSLGDSAAVDRLNQKMDEEVRNIHPSRLGPI